MYITRAFLLEKATGAVTERDASMISLVTELLSGGRGPYRYAGFRRQCLITSAVHISSEVQLVGNEWSVVGGREIGRSWEAAKAKAGLKGGGVCVT